MCRYAFHSYKSHFACFDCRKTFKKTPIDDYVIRAGLEKAFQEITEVYGSKRLRKEAEERFGITYEEIRERYLADVSSCPQCGKRMAAMGLDFRAPRKADEEAWDIVRELYDQGFSFTGCGCHVGYKPPAKKSELEAWLRTHRRAGAGEVLLSAILEKRG